MRESALESFITRKPEKWAPNPYSLTTRFRICGKTHRSLSLELWRTDRAGAIVRSSQDPSLRPKLRRSGCIRLYVRLLCRKSVTILLPWPVGYGAAGGPALSLAHVPEWAKVTGKSLAWCGQQSRTCREVRYAHTRNATPENCNGQIPPRSTGD